MRKNIDLKKIAFISCVNNEQVYAESCHYIEHLQVSPGYKAEMIAVRDASSMASGYNIGMKRTDAKYKIYMHQDVFIINKDLISQLLQIFQSDNRIGMVGMIGTKTLSESAIAVTDWNVGKVISNGTPPVLEFPQGEGLYEEAQAADGFLLATQTDILWREDIFDGWDFYDISQCMEFQKAGYKVVIPNQERPWCCHDNEYSKMTRYEHYRKLFCQEYACMSGFEFREQSNDLTAYESAKETARKAIAQLLSQGAVSELRTLFQAPQNQGYLYLREYECIVVIDWLEEQNRSDIRFWTNTLSVKQLTEKLRNLKYLLKRIEYDTTECEKEYALIRENYSQYAVTVICDYYHIKL